MNGSKRPLVSLAKISNDQPIELDLKKYIDDSLLRFSIFNKYGFVASGGDAGIIEENGEYYKIHFFDDAASVKEFEAICDLDATVFLVGGGAAGGGSYAYGVGASGAAGQVKTVNLSIKKGVYGITVGSAGKPADLQLIFDRVSNGDGGDGGNTIAFDITAHGGRGGAGRHRLLTTNYQAIADNGLGSGVANNTLTVPSIISPTTHNHDGFFAGSANKNAVSNSCLVSSGAASSAGNGGDGIANWGNTGSFGGKGADGVLTTIRGSEEYFGGAAGGSTRYYGDGGKGGLGGGADGVSGGHSLNAEYLSHGLNATFYGGSGSGGANSTGLTNGCAAGGAGYKGCVIIRYKIKPFEIL